MKRFILIISILASGLLSNAVLAEAYWGAKAAIVDINAKKYTNTLNIGLFVGAEFAQAGSNIV